MKNSSIGLAISYIIEYLKDNKWVKLQEFNRITDAEFYLDSEIFIPHNPHPIQVRIRDEITDEIIEVRWW